MPRIGISSVLSLTALLFISNQAMAHVSVASGPVYAGGRAVVTFGVGHGCEGADTVSVEVKIPSEITSVRGVPNILGPAQVVTDDAGVVTAVKWAKDTAQPADDQYYELQIRISVPDMPFTTLYLPATQVCRAEDGTETTVEWAALPGDEPPEGEEEVPPAPALVIMPARQSGWNKYTVPAKIDDLSIFDDALIVWSGDAAYSSNPNTAALIEDEDDVDVLESVAKDAEIWVKY